MENVSEVKVSAASRLCYGIVGNIPKEFRSADLRAMFSNFIEAKGFDCFHFRHRPEFRRITASSSGDDCVKTQESSTTCCVVSIVERKLQELIKCYHGKNWVDRNGKYFPSKAVISKVRTVEENDSCEYKSYKTRKEKRQIAVSRTNIEFSSRDLKEMPELHPPHLMPNGNVGTTLAVFMELIRTCQLPPHVIKKLGLNFPSNKLKKKYSNVQLDYKSLEKVPFSEVQCGHIGKKAGREPKLQHVAAELDSCACGDVQNPDFSEANKSTYDSTAHSHDEKHPDFSEVNKSPYQSSVHSDNEKHPDFSEVNKSTYQSSRHSDNEKHPESDDDSSLEEWDRHEALHNDVTSQERTKERLFEEEIELKWEKGGSGLVFYTDAAFWKQQEEADFDEETADDWDVDMEIYENGDGGDKDSRDLLQLRLESQWRKGNDIDLNKIGDFEKHTRGFGGQLMRQQGWKEGGSLGSSQVGITEPVHADGQLPTCKRGIGYYGEKLQRHVKRPRAERSVIISTVYDKPDEHEEELFRSCGPDRLKYINSVDFVRAKSLPKNTGTGQ